MPAQAGRDIYYRQAKLEGWRARSAYKLLQIDEVYEIFAGVTRAVDLCAAPGSWSQVLSRKLYLPYLQKNGSSTEGGPKIVAVDLQPIGPVEGVEMIQGDITSETTARRIIDIFKGHQADLVVCDGAPDVTGLHDLDQWTQSQLLLAVLAIVTNVLRPGGTFVAKIFAKEKADLLFCQVKLLFEEVDIYKPRSSRPASAEAFIVCQRLALPEGITAESLMGQWNQNRGEEEWTPNEKLLVPFLFGGDLSGYDQLEH